MIHLKTAYYNMLVLFFQVAKSGCFFFWAPRTGLKTIILANRDC